MILIICKTVTMCMLLISNSLQNPWQQQLSFCFHSFIMLLSICNNTMKLVCSVALDHLSTSIADHKRIGRGGFDNTRAVPLEALLLRNGSNLINIFVPNYQLNCLSNNTFV